MTILENISYNNSSKKYGNNPNRLGYFKIQESAENNSDRGDGDVKAGRNVVLIGVTGAGKSSVGWHLARHLGFGFLDLDGWIVKRAGKPIEAIFSQNNETEFRRLEAEVLRDVANCRNHVIAVGGGTVVDDENRRIVRSLGVCVWLDTAPSEVARRLVMKPDEIAARPLLADVLNAPSKEERFQRLNDRIEEIIKHRQARYGEAEIRVSDSYSTSDATAQSVYDALLKKKFFQRR